jgi:peptide/nickel transport system permease protein
MWKYIVNRIIQIIITLVVFFALTYFILDAQPGDITMQYTNNPKFTKEMRADLQKRLGLDRPVLERFFKWMGNTLTGNLGVSYQERRPVIDIIAERAPRTIFLFSAALLIEFVIGYALGKMLAWSRGSGVEYGVTIFGAIMYTIFTPWFALMMILLFGSILKWFPKNSFLSDELWRKVSRETGMTLNSNAIFGRMILTVVLIALAIIVILVATRKMNAIKAKRMRIELSVVVTAIGIGAWLVQYPNNVLAGDILYHMVLPVFVLVCVNFSGMMLLTRTTMLETLREDYIMAARAKGISEREVRDKHAARNAFLPVFTSMILSLPAVISGGIITETVFSWPGMGRQLLEASTVGDVPMVMGAFLFIGVLSLMAHFIADVCYAFLDPRIRYA